MRSLAQHYQKTLLLFDLTRCNRLLTQGTIIPCMLTPYQYDNFASYTLPTHLLANMRSAIDNTGHVAPHFGTVIPQLVEPW